MESVFSGVNKSRFRLRLKHTPDPHSLTSVYRLCSRYLSDYIANMWILYKALFQEEKSQGWEERKRSGGPEIGTIARLSLQRKSMWC